MTGLRKRKIIVTFHMPSGDVILDETFDIRIRAEKDCLSSQNYAAIEITNLTQGIRQELLSQFTAFNRRKTAAGQIAPAYLDVEIAAGYLSDDGTDTTSTIYHGQVVECDLVQGPPNVTVRIACFTHQVDKVNYIDQPPPYEMTFKDLVYWAGEKLGFDKAHVRCDTKYDAAIAFNAARSTVVAGDLPLYLEQYFYPDVAAYIDDNFLIVKDRYKVLNPGDTVTLNEFVGIPCWNEWGVEGTVFMDPGIKVAQAAKFVSTQNPSLNTTYVIMKISYELTSRGVPFFCHVEASPSA